MSGMDRQSDNNNENDFRRVKDANSPIGLMRIKNELGLLKQPTEKESKELKLQEKSNYDNLLKQNAAPAQQTPAQAQQTPAPVQQQVQAPAPAQAQQTQVTPPTMADLQQAKQAMEKAISEQKHLEAAATQLAEAEENTAAESARIAAEQLKKLKERRAASKALVEAATTEAECSSSVSNASAGKLATTIFGRRYAFIAAAKKARTPNPRAA